MYFRLVPLLSTICAFISGIRASFSSAVADSDLICHTNHASECYPRAFQPTTYFQRVHDDQELPPGLHIRVNLETGKKEAKFNDISDGIDGEPVDVAIVKALDDNGETLDKAIDETPFEQIHGQQILKATEQGSIRPPSSDSGEGESFTSSQLILKDTTENPDPDTLLPALEVLEDLSHDIYWGLTLVKDASTVQKLVGLLTLNTSDTRIKAGAALVFGTALQNNPAALTSALSHCYNDELPTGPMEAVFMALLHEQLPQLLARFMYLLSALCKDQTQLMRFMNKGGMDILLNVFDAESAGLDGKDHLRLKIANFVLDHFLQPHFVKMKLPKNRTNVDDEVDTHLEHEDTHRAEGRYLTKVLKPWCSSFSTSISKWKSSKEESKAFVSVKDMEEVYTALKLKLAEFGCDCEEDGIPHREL